MVPVDRKAQKDIERFVRALPDGIRETVQSELPLGDIDQVRQRVQELMTENNGCCGF